MSLIRVGETHETFFYPIPVGYSARATRTADSQAGDSSKTTYLFTFFQLCFRVDLCLKLSTYSCANQVHCLNRISFRSKGRLLCEYARKKGQDSLYPNRSDFCCSLTDSHSPQRPFPSLAEYNVSLQEIPIGVKQTGRAQPYIPACFPLSPTPFCYEVKQE